MTDTDHKTCNSSNNSNKIHNNHTICNGTVCKSSVHDDATETDHRLGGANIISQSGPQMAIVVVSVALILPLISLMNHQGGLARAQLLANAGGVNFQHPALPRANAPAEPEPNSYERKDTAPETLDIIKQRGFIGEMYRVRSRWDGHLLVVFHIINPLADPTKLHKYPVLISHGISGDSSQMISRSGKSKPRKPRPGQIQFEATDDNTAFMLANNNFDVWLRDARGVTLNDHDPNVDSNLLEGSKFWNFSLDEQSQYDTPTEIDFVLEQTQTDKLHYIGFSESTFMILALMSWQPWYQDKLASVICLAPIAYVYRATGSIMAAFLPSILAPDNVGIDYFPQVLVDSVGYSMNNICSQKVFAEGFCKTVGGAAFGFGVESDSADIQATYFKKTSLKAFKHFIQLFLQRRFGMYDYGPRGNLLQYGQPQPPAYNLRNIVMPRLVLLRGGSDWLSRVADQQLLISQLGSPLYLDVLLPDYNHMDFLVSKTLLRDVNVPIGNVIFQHLNELNPAGNILRNALHSRSPAHNPFAKPPEAIAQPDGTTQALTQKSIMLHNIVRGIYGTGESAYVDRSGGLDQQTLRYQAQPLASTLLNPIRTVAKAIAPARAIDGYVKLIDGYLGIPGNILNHIL